MNNKRNALSILTLNCEIDRLPVKQTHFTPQTFTNLYISLGTVSLTDVFIIQLLAADQTRVMQEQMQMQMQMPQDPSKAFKVGNTTVAANSKSNTVAITMNKILQWPTLPERILVCVGYSVTRCIATVVCTSSLMEG